MESNKILQSDYLDLLYSNRNKNYGAYTLRKNYTKRATKALSITLALVITSIAAPTLLSRAESNSSLDNNNNIHETVTICTILPPTKPEPEPPKPKANETQSAPKQRAKTTHFTTPDIVANNRVTPAVKPPNMDELNNTLAGPVTFDGEGGEEIATNNKPHSGPFGNGVDSIGDAEISKPPADEPLIIAEVAPEFPGGLKALYEYLSKQVKYPRAAAESGIQGKVVIKFVVNGQGGIEQAQVLRTIGGGCDKEALRVVNGMPKWKPGKQNGHPVKVYYTLPIEFRMN